MRAIPYLILYAVVLGLLTYGFFLIEKGELVLGGAVAGAGALLAIVAFVRVLAVRERLQREMVLIARMNGYAPLTRLEKVKLTAVLGAMHEGLIFIERAYGKSAAGASLACATYWQVGENLQKHVSLIAYSMLPQTSLDMRSDERLCAEANLPAGFNLHRSRDWIVVTHGANRDADLLAATSAFERLVSLANQGL